MRSISIIVLELPWNAEEYQGIWRIVERNGSTGVSVFPTDCRKTFHLITATGNSGLMTIIVLGWLLLHLSLEVLLLLHLLEIVVCKLPWWHRTITRRTITRREWMGRGLYKHVSTLWQVMSQRFPWSNRMVMVTTHTVVSHCDRLGLLSYSQRRRVLKLTKWNFIFTFFFTDLLFPTKVQWRENQCP